MRWITALALMVLTLTANVSAAQQGAEQPESGPRSLTLFTTETDPPQLEALNDIISQYREINPDVSIDVVTGTYVMRADRTSTMLAAGADVGIFEVEPDFAPEWARDGLLLPLDDVVAANGGVEAYAPGSLLIHEGHVYGVPYATSVYALWYRQDLFEQAGIDVPTNYDELLAAAQALTDPAAGIYGLSVPGTANASSSYFSTFLWQNCLDYYTPTGELTFGQPAVFEAIERWVALTEYAPPGFENWTWGDQITAFVTGQAAMSIYGGRMGWRIADGASHLEAVTGLARVPWSYVEGGPYVSYGSWSRVAIAANTAYPETSKDFLRFWLSGDRLAAYDAAVIGHMVPPLQDVAAQLENWDSDYARTHADWVTFFNENAAFTNHPSNNMGSVVGCTFNRRDSAPPWGREIFESGGVVDAMLTNIYNGQAPETAWGEAVVEMQEIQLDWLALHPGWILPAP